MEYIPINKQDTPNDIRDSYNANCIAQISNPEELAYLVQTFEEQWDIPVEDMESAGNFLSEEVILKRFNVGDFGRITTDLINEKLAEAERTLKSLHIQTSTNNLFEADPAGNGIGIGYRINRCINIIKSWELILKNFKTIYDFIKNPVSGEDTFDPSNLLGPSALDPTRNDDNNDYQQCIIYALERLRQERYKRYKGWVCEQISHTRAWKKVMPIEDYIETLFQKETDIQMWRKYTKTGANRKNLTEHLRCCVDPMFPELKKNRHVFSFQDGIFVAKDDSVEGWFNFYPYNSEKFRQMPANLVSAKYFDMPFGKFEYETWKDIETPVLDTILDYQDFDAEVKRWMYIFIGRMVFDVNEMDKWQVVPFHKGMASTGKGKLCEICAHFYDGEDVGQLSDLPEKSFGLSAIFDKLMFVAPEITERFGLGQAEFQSMVSGELVSVAQKFKTAQAIEWTTPGMFAGNEPPGYRDNSGSIQRRMVIFPFSNQVLAEHMDMELPQKMKAETAKILYKCVWAYQEAAGMYKKAGIWSVLPPMLLKAKEEMALSTNSLRHFMASERVEFGEDKMVPMTCIIEEFNQHCKANNLGKYRFTPDFYNGPFGARKLRVEGHSGEYNGKVYSRQNWVRGIDLLADDYLQNFSNDI